MSKPCASFTHARAAILTIGDELVLGQKPDTNAQSIADRLVARGLEIAEHVCIPDDLPTIVSSIRRLADTVDLLIVTGGLGPTRDDLTRAGLAAALGEELVLDQEALARVQAWFSSRGRTMPEGNIDQARRPSSARMLANDNGTAPGLHAVANDRCDIFCLPGPPREMIPILERDVLSSLRVDRERWVCTRAVHTFGRGESDIAALLGGLMDRGRNPLVGTTASLGVVTVRIRATGPDAERLAAESQAQVRQILGPVVLAHEDLALEVLEHLRARQETLASVESCTGGLVGKLITDLPGSSLAYKGGLVTYSNELKHAFADVPSAVFEGDGAVSRACAVGMAEGGRSRCGADHALAITGIAGPDGGSAEKPVGTVWIALASRQAPTDVRRFVFRGSRDAVRTWAAMTALGMLRLRLIGEDMRLLNQQEP
ncbi:MAG: competence/damage-inducible protein A [Phycisphaerales bacterium]